MKIETTSEDISKYSVLMAVGLVQTLGIKMTKRQMILMQEASVKDIELNDSIRKSAEQFEDIMKVYI